MLVTTDDVIAAWLSPSRQLSIRVKMNDVTYGSEDITSLSFDSGSISGETYQIGSTYMNSIQLVFPSIIETVKEDLEVVPELAVLVNGNYEYTKLGHFFIDEFERNRNSNTTTIKATDKMRFMEGPYESKLSYKKPYREVALEVANLAGFEINEASFSALGTAAINKPEGYTFRQAIGLIAQFEGGFASFNRNGELEIRRLAPTNFEITPESYMLKGFTKNEVSYRIGGITVKTGEEETDVIRVGSTNGSQVQLENKVMTQQLLNQIWELVKNLNYFPYELKWRGCPPLEAGDWIYITANDGTKYSVPNLSYSITFNGGMLAESKATTSSSSQATYKYRGPLNQRIDYLDSILSSNNWNSNYYDTTEPRNPKEGDIWFKPNGQDTEIWIYRNVDGVLKWVMEITSAGDPELLAAIEDAKKAGQDAEEAAKEAKEEAESAKQAGENAANLATQAGLDAQAAKDKADVIKIDVNGLVSDIATINGTVSSISSKANQAYDKANAVEGRTATLETSVTGLTGRITDIETTSTSTTKKLNELVVTVDGQKQTIATVTATADSALSKANVLESTVDGVKQTLTSVESTISNIGSSGTNLLINGGFENDLFGWGSSGNSSVHKIDTSEVHTGRKSLKIDAAGSVKIISLNVRIPVYQGQQLEFSLWYKTTDNFNGTSDNNKFRVGKQDGTLLTSYGFSGPFTEWTNRVATLTVGSGITELELRIDSNHSSGTVWWDDISIVDVTSKNQTNTKINQITDTVDGHTQLIASTKTTADSALTKATQVETTANGLKTTISSVETTANTALTKATQVEQTADGLVSTVNRIDGGGTNLVSNGGFENDYVGWTQPTGFTITTNDSHSGSKSLAVSNTGSAGRAIGRRLNVPVVPGRKYEVSYWYKTTADANGVSGNQKLRIGQANGTLINALGWDGASTEWSQKSQIYTAGTNIFEWSITLTASHTVGTVWWDDISIVDVTDREATASQITQLSDTINLKVSKNDVVNQINLSTEGVLIAGNKIQIVGTTYIADAVIKSGNIADLAVTNGKIANLAVTEGKIGNAAITTAKIGDLSVSTAKIADGAIVNAKIGNAAITNAKIADASISSAKIINIDASKIVANSLAAITTNTGTLNVTGWLTMSTENRGMMGTYDFGDQYESAFNYRWFVGDWRLSHRHLIFTGKAYTVTSSNNKGSYLYDVETFYGNDYMKMRQYNSSGTLLNRIDINSDGIAMSDRDWGGGSRTIIRSNGTADFYSRVNFNAGIDVAAPTNVGIRTGRIDASLNYDTISINAERPGLTDVVFGISNVNFNTMKTGSADWRIGLDGIGRTIQSMAVYNRTYGSSSNMYITESGTLGRSTSATKYKLNITEAPEIEDLGFKLLTVMPKYWFDKSNIELAAKDLAYGGLNDVDPITLRPHYGLIAEDLLGAGLEMFISTKYQTGEIEGIEYDRLWVTLIPIVKSLVEKNVLLEVRLNKIERVMEELVNG
ncbi:hypothetical protein FDP56_07410 [Enterococcus casseliflavus]|uniref:carbohydrate binding domain-containing protein n=1 Tax=Enterococcus casseliflavus TaxID=37734 RepID=UPI00129C9767|nr:carbohydrate binding domain-containing protein [Enterococcus casseliflavus]MRI70245.1 hypothetical protein [Enterococcus casseliflavus]